MWNSNRMLSTEYCNSNDLRVTSNDSKILTDAERRAASLRQLLVWTALLHGNTYRVSSVWRRPQANDD